MVKGQLPLLAAWIVSMVLVVVGALNWLLVAFGFNLVEWLLPWKWLQNTVYVLVGIAGVFVLVSLPMVAAKVWRR